MWLILFFFSLIGAYFSLVHKTEKVHNSINPNTQDVLKRKYGVLSFRLANEYGMRFEYDTGDMFLYSIPIQTINYEWSCLYVVLRKDNYDGEFKLDSYLLCPDKKIDGLKIEGYDLDNIKDIDRALELSLSAILNTDLQSSDIIRRMKRNNKKSINNATVN